MRQVRSHSLAGVSFRVFALLLTLQLTLSLRSKAQDTPPKTPQSSEKVVTSPEAPAQIELLETHIRFEANGDSRKEVHARVRINNELGARQFSHVSFDYNRSFQQVEIPLMRITHASGGTADILPSAIVDQPNPAAVNAPAYEDVRVKSVRILGLAPGDILEYRVVTSMTHGPFAPNFYLSHNLAHDAVVSQELFEIDVPASRAVKPWTSQAAQAFETEKLGEGEDGRVVYRWKTSETKPESQDANKSSASTTATSDLPVSPAEPDIAVTTFLGWADLSTALQKPFATFAVPAPEIRAKAAELVRNATTPEDKLRVLYDFVSQKIATVDLPLGTTGFRLRAPAAILSSAYAIPEEKCSLLSALAWSIGLHAKPVLAAPRANSQRGPAVPSTLTNALVVTRLAGKAIWLDPSVEVAPFGMIASNIRGKPALLLFPVSDVQVFEDVGKNLPFAAWQHVNVDALLAADGTLHAKVHYTMRGDNELLLRVAFHESPREKWKDVAQLLALSDGFRGKIMSASASDPYATKEPFTVEYEISQPKFVDWSRKPVRIPALLPLLSLPEPPEKSSPDAAPSPIDLGTPLDVETRATLHLPPGTTAQVPFGSSVERDYATFRSRYAKQATSVSATRHINFLFRAVPAARSADYAAFLHAVQTDQSQLFTLDHPDTSPATPPPPPPQSTASPKPRR